MVVTLQIFKAFHKSRVLFFFIISNMTENFFKKPLFFKKKWHWLTQKGEISPTVQYYSLKFCTTTTKGSRLFSQQKKIGMFGLIMSYLPLKLAEKSNSRADNSKMRSPTPKFFLLKMFLSSYSNNMLSLKKFYKKL